MIHAFALEPEVVATWGRLEEFRFIYDKFGLGTPRALLELPKFTKWKGAVYDAARNLALTDTDIKRIEELFRILGEKRCRRTHPVYDGDANWLEKAEAEFERRPFAGNQDSGGPFTFWREVAWPSCALSSTLDGKLGTWGGLTPARIY